MTCKICKGATHKISEQLVLQKYQVAYHQCSTCHFIQTDEPFWLAEAYNTAITALDIGLINRNLHFQKKIPVLLDAFFPNAQTMLDYGGGYGMFVRMMRDHGYEFYRQDNYCENLFAAHFDLSDSPAKKFDILTAFEVFEHLDNPLTEIEKMWAFSDTIIFSTVLSPPSVQAFQNWWYVSPLTGQHIAFYDHTTLQTIAKIFGKKLYTNGELHVFTTKELHPSIVASAFNEPEKPLLQRIADRLFAKRPVLKHRTSLLQKDYELVEKKLRAKVNK
jgi:hypothetical protein